MKRFQVYVNGQLFEVLIGEVGEQAYSFQPTSITPQVEAQPVPMSPATSQWQRQTPTAAVSHAPRATAPAAPRCRPVPKPKPKQNIKVEGETPVTAPMPGSVLDIKVEIGDSINEGDILLILEAMKMENEVTAPASGKIKSIDVEKGSTVNAGDLMLVIT